MAFPEATYPYPLGGHPNGRYRQAVATTPSSAADPTNPTYLGAIAQASYTYTGANPAIEDAGIRAGEIIGYRAWLLKDDGLLHGMFCSDYIWKPNTVEHEPNVNPTWGAGLHAFKTLLNAKKQYGFYAYGGERVVFGEVALWGEVIEHEGGYRAEYAAIRQLIVVFENTIPVVRTWSWQFWKPSALKILRKRYNLSLSSGDR